MDNKNPSRPLNAHLWPKTLNVVFQTYQETINLFPHKNKKTATKAQQKMLELELQR